MNRLPRALSLFVFASTASFGIVTPVSAADPTIAECLTANDKSISLRNERKLLASRKELLVCAASTCPAEVRKECMRRIDQVNASLPTVVLEAKDGAGNDLTAVKVTMNGDVLVDKLDGSAITLDPGAHTFTFEAPGQPPITKQLVIREGQKDRREVLQFGTPPATTPASGAAPVTKATPNPAIETSVDQVSSSSGNTQKIVALVAGGVGVVGIGVGTIFGLQSMSKHSDAEKQCPGACSDQAGVDLWNDARSAGNISTIGFVVGGVGLATGAILWLTAKPSRTTLRADVGPGTVQIRGTW